MKKNTDILLKVIQMVTPGYLRLSTVTAHYGSMIHLRVIGERLEYQELQDIGHLDLRDTKWGYGEMVETGGFGISCIQTNFQS